MSGTINALNINSENITVTNLNVTNINGRPYTGSGGCGSYYTSCPSCDGGTSNSEDPCVDCGTEVVDVDPCDCLVPDPCIGPQGPQGATGAQGATGMQGYTGSTGAQGYTGATGARGATGMQGYTGAQGATGSSSPWIPMNGLAGSTGGYTGIGITGQDVLIYGNLLVTGGIDPTYLALTPQPNGPQGFVNPLWVDNSANLRSEKILLQLGNSGNNCSISSTNIIITDGTTLTSELQSGVLSFTDTSGFNSSIQGSGAVFGDTNNNSSGQYAVSGFYCSDATVEAPYFPTLTGNSDGGVISQINHSQYDEYNRYVATSVDWLNGFKMSNLNWSEGLNTGITREIQLTCGTADSFSGAIQGASLSYNYSGGDSDSFDFYVNGGAKIFGFSDNLLQVWPTAQFYNSSTTGIQFRIYQGQLAINVSANISTYSWDGIVITDGTTTNTINKNGYTTKNSVQNATHYLNFSDSSSTGVGAIQKTAGISCNPNTNIITATTFVGDLSGNVAIGTDNASTLVYPTFVKTSGAGNKGLFIDDTTTPLTFNPSTGALTTTSFVASASGSTNTITSSRIDVANSGGTLAITQGALTASANYAINSTSGQVINLQTNGTTQSSITTNGVQETLLTTQGTATYSSPTLTLVTTASAPYPTIYTNLITFSGSAVAQTISAITVPTNMPVNGMYMVYITNNNTSAGAITVNATTLGTGIKTTYTANVVIPISGFALGSLTKVGASAWIWSINLVA